MHEKAGVVAKAKFCFHPYPFHRHFLVFLLALIGLFLTWNFAEGDLEKRLGQAFAAGCYLPYLV